MTSLMQERFLLKSEFIPLCDLLKIVGVVDSGGAGKALVASGDIAVNGQVETRKTCKIRDGQRVTGPGFVIQVVADLEPIAPPLLADNACCGSGCDPCVSDLYQQELAEWKKAHAEWKARQS